MSLRRREFCAALASLSLAPGAIHEVTIHAFCEDETVKLKQEDTLWSGGGVLVRMEKSAVYVSSPQKRLLRLRIHWPRTFPKAIDIWVTRGSEATAISAGARSSRNESSPGISSSAEQALPKAGVGSGYGPMDFRERVSASVHGIVA